MQLTKYCLGFYFDTTFGVSPKVALIRKARPAWQAGMLNGVGGHVEPGETPDAAMRREFLEETGVLFNNWTRFTTMVFDKPDEQILIYCYRGYTPPRAGSAYRTLTLGTDEPVSWFHLKDMGNWIHMAIPNLRWLIPMAYCAQLYYKEINGGASEYQRLDEIKEGF